MAFARSILRVNDLWFPNRRTTTYQVQVLLRGPLHVSGYWRIDFTFGIPVPQKRRKRNAFKRQMRTICTAENKTTHASSTHHSHFMIMLVSAGALPCQLDDLKQIIPPLLYPSLTPPRVVKMNQRRKNMMNVSPPANDKRLVFPVLVCKVLQRERVQQLSDNRSGIFRRLWIPHRRG